MEDCTIADTSSKRMDIEKTSENRVKSNDLYWDADSLHVSKKSKFISDGIASDLFLINL